MKLWRCVAVCRRQISWRRIGEVAGGQWRGPRRIGYDSCRSMLFIVSIYYKVKNKPLAIFLFSLFSYSCVRAWRSVSRYDIMSEHSETKYFQCPSTKRLARLCSITRQLRRDLRSPLVILTLARAISESFASFCIYLLSLDLVAFVFKDWNDLPFAIWKARFILLILGRRSWAVWAEDRCSTRWGMLTSSSFLSLRGKDKFSSKQ